MASSSGSLLVEVGLGLARLQGDIGKMQHMMGRATSQISSAFKTLGIGIGASLSAAGIISFIKSAIDLGETINKASQKFGIGTESLSALKYAAELSDVAFEDLGIGLKKLSQNMAEGNKAFGLMRISLKMANGELRPTEEVMLDIAEAFSKYKDNAAKTALAVELFGKQGANLIPLLNQGKGGIKELMEEAKKLGIVIGPEAAKKSEEFNDNLKRLKSSASGLGMEIANVVVPALNAMLEGILSINQAWRDHKKAIVESGLDMLAPIEGIWSVPDISRIRPRFGATDDETRNFSAILDRMRTKISAPIIPKGGEGKDKFHPIDPETWELSLELISKRYEELQNSMNLLPLEDHEAKLRSMAASMKDFGETDLSDWGTMFKTFQEQFDAAFAAGDVATAISLINEHLGAQWIALEEGQTKIRAFSDVWMEANKSISTAAIEIGMSIRDNFVDLFSDVIIGVRTAGEAFAEMGKAILKMLTETLLKWIVNRTIMAAMGKTFMAAETAATIAFGATTAAALAPAAAFMEIITLGGASGPAMAGLAATVGLAQALSIPMMAEGGIITRPTMVMAGERGREAIIPLDEGKELLGPSSKGGQIIELHVDGERWFRWIENGQRQGRLVLRPS